MVEEIPLSVFNGDFAEIPYEFGVETILKKEIMLRLDFDPELVDPLEYARIPKLFHSPNVEDSRQYYRFTLERDQDSSPAPTDGSLSISDDHELSIFIQEDKN